MLSEMIRIIINEINRQGLSALILNIQTGEILAFGENMPFESIMHKTSPLLKLSVGEAVKPGSMLHRARLSDDCCCLFAHEVYAICMNEYAVAVLNENGFCESGNEDFIQLCENLSGFIQTTYACDIDSKNNAAELPDLINAIGEDYLRNMMMLYCEVMDSRSTIYAPDGTILADSGDVNSLCTLGLSSGIGRATCEACTRNLLAEADATCVPIHSACAMFGLQRAAAPVFVEGSRVATWTTGNFRPCEFTREFVFERAKAAGIDPHEALEAYLRTPAASEGYINRVIHLLDGFSKEVGAMATRGLQLLRENAAAREARSKIEQNYMDQIMITGLYNKLTDGANLKSAVQGALEDSARYLGMSKAYIFEDDLSGKTATCTFYWTRDGDRGEIPKSIAYSCLSKEITNGLFEYSHAVLESLAKGAEFPANPAIFTALSGDSIGGFIGFEGDVPSLLVKNEKGLFQLIGGIFSTALARMRAEENLVYSHDMFKTVLDNVDSIVIVTDMQTGEILFANEKACEFTRCENLTGRSCRDVLCDGRNGVCPDCSRLETEAGNAALCSVNEVFNERYGAWLRITASHVRWVDGRLAHIQSMVDITQNKLQALNVERIAFSDYLLGIPNRLRCEHDLAGELEMAKCGKARGAVLFIDLDDFKNINDTFGHDYGDLLLKQVAAYFSSQPEIKDSYYRFGGDEFVILIRGTKAGETENFCSKVMERFRKPWVIQGRAHYCTASIGVSYYPRDGSTVGELIRRADIAMYEAKNSGKNSVTSFAGEDNQDIRSRKETEVRLKEAAKDIPANFRIYYHPIINMSDGSVIGAEALLRWVDAKSGVVPAGEFIETADYLGLMLRIEEWVLRTACLQCRQWQREGLENFGISINVSKRLLRTDGFVAVVRTALEESGLKPYCLTLETGEAPDGRDANGIRRVMRELHDIGVRIAVDHFGAEASALSLLRDLPVDVVKIDRLFVRELNQEGFSNAFVRAVIGLAHDIGMQVCVEGIEDHEQSNAAYGLLTDMAQGYYYFRPQPAEQFFRIIKS